MQNFIIYINHQLSLGYLKSSRVKWVSYTAHTNKRYAYKLCLENMKVREHLEDPGINGRALFKQILKKHNGKLWNGFILLRTGISRNDLWVP